MLTQIWNRIRRISIFFRFGLNSGNPRIMGLPLCICLGCSLSFLHVSFFFFCLPAPPRESANPQPLKDNYRSVLSEIFPDIFICTRQKANRTRIAKQLHLRSAATEKNTERSSNAQNNDRNTWQHATLIRVTRGEACTQKCDVFRFCCASREKISNTKNTWRHATLIRVTCGEASTHKKNDVFWYCCATC